VRTIADNLGVRCVMVVQSDRLDPERLRSLICWVDGALADNLLFVAAGSPFERLARSGRYTCAEAVQDAFPGQPLLQRVSAASFSGICLEDPGGAVIGQICVLHDQPLRHVDEVEAALRLYASRSAAELERIQVHGEVTALSCQLETLTRHLPGLVYTIRAHRDGQRELLFESRSCAALLGGRELSEILVDPELFLELVHPEDRRHLDGGPVLDPLLSQAVDREFRIRDGRGGYHWIRSIAQPAPDCDRSVSWHGLLLDVDARRCAQSELEAREAELDTLVRSVPDAVFFKDGQGRLKIANGAAQEIFGLEGDEWRGQTIEGLLRLYPSHAAAFQQCAETDERAWERGERLVSLESFSGESGQHTFEVTKVPLFDPDGGRHGLVVVARDLTRQLEDEQDRRRMEQQLHLSRKMEALGQLAGGIAHDFDNLLTVILGYTDLARPRLEALVGERGFLEESLDQINRAAAQAAGLTRKLLAFGRRDHSQPEPRNPATVIEDVRGLLDRLIGEHIEVRYALAPNLPWLRSGEGQVEQILVNLAVNGRDAMPNGGQLRIAASPADLESSPPGVYPALEPGRYLLLEVEDQGEGIAPEHWERVFEPFFTTKEPGKGTGLGLATVYGIVTHLGGGLSLVSKLGQGSVFQAWLPAVEGAVVDPPAASRPTGQSAAPHPSGTILLCEDEEAVRLLACRILEAAGYTVIPTASGVEALQKLDAPALGVDLLVTDVMMPGLNGNELAQQLRLRRPEVPVLFISGYSAEILATQKLRAEEVDLLEKPFRPFELLERVGRAIAAGPVRADLK